MALTTSAFALTIGLAAPAAAQDTPAPQPDQNQSTTSTVDNPPACEDLPEGAARDNCISGEVEIESGQAATSGQEITVTGSRIRRPNLESNVPVTSVSVEDLTSQGDVNVGDALNDLPSLRSTFSQANSTRFIGTTGLNVLDLRGLGTSRTLVLVNGRRHVTASPGDFLVDTNTIPSDLLERVDVVTGGSSAVYGSDAVAGVVNFVLKRDFEGVKVRGQAGTSSRGDRGIQFVSLTAGRNFFDDRANIATNLEYVNADPLYFNQRDELTGARSGRCQLNANDFTGQIFGGTLGNTTEPATGDDVPDQAFFCGVRNNAISTGGTVFPGTVNAVTNPASTQFVNSCVNPANAANPIFIARCINVGTPQGQPRTFRFDAAGNLIEDVPALDFRPFGSGNIISNPLSTVPGTTLRETGQLFPGLDRYTANILAHFDVAEAFRPFVEAKYVHVKGLQEGQPSFFQGGAFGTVRCDNGFLNTQNITQLQAIGLCPAGNVPVFDTRVTIPGPGGTTIPNPNLGADITPGIPLGRFNVDFGGRSELIKRDTYRVVGGVTGDFNDDWNYEVSVNYGRVKIRQDQRNNLVRFDEDGQPIFQSALDAVLDPASGQVVCRINSSLDLFRTGPNAGTLNTANDNPACVPINVLGTGAPSQEALNFVNTTSFVKQKASQLDALAFVSGDTSQLFELQGGPARFVVGGEYRREKANLFADPLSATIVNGVGSTFFNAFAPFDPPTLKVKEVFGEFELPIFRNLPTAHELTLTAAARYSDYNEGAGNAGNTFAYNVNGTYSPIRDIRFRANYSRSVRVPTPSDLFTPNTQNFAQLADPCDAARIGPETATRAINCRALGVPVGFVATFTNSQTAQIVSAGNPNLEEEVGKSLTLGAVFTPRFIPGFSFTVDYYRIRVNNLIAVLGGQTILNLCVDQPTTSNQFCQLINERQTVDDPATLQNDVGALQNPALTSAGVNFAKQEADGIDFEAAYRRTFGNGHRLNLRGILTYVLKRNNYVDPTQPNFRDRLLTELGDPEISANASATYGFGPVDIRYSLNYIGKQTVGAYESYFPVQGRDPTNEDLTREVFYPDVFYHAARVNFNIQKKFDFYVGMDNIFDTKPPLGLLGNEGGVPFDAVGRYVYAGATVTF